MENHILKIVFEREPASAACSLVAWMKRAETVQPEWAETGVQHYGQVVEADSTRNGRRA